MNRIAQKIENKIKRRRRVRSRIRGTSERPRLSVHKSNNHMYVQIINDEKGETVAATNSLMLGKKDPAALGADIAKRAQEAGVTKVVFDRGGHAYTGAIQTLAEKAREAGLSM